METNNNLKETEAQRMERAEKNLDDHYSDEGLANMLLSGAPGIERQAMILKDFPANMRAAIVQEAHYRSNLSNVGRWSDAVRLAASYAPNFTSPTAISMWEGKQKG